MQSAKHKGINMDMQYQPIYRQAAAAQNMFHNYTHTTAHDPTATVLRNEIHKLTNDLASGRNPRAIEQRVRTIQTQLQRTQMRNPSALPGASPVLNFKQSQMLHSNFEAMRRNIRQHPNF
jgi:hypothetical protein